MLPSPIFLTGATGHLGVAIARALLALPHPPEVRLLVRDPAKVHALIATDDALAPLDRAALVVGDFRDPAVLSHGLRGARAVIHNLHSHEYWKGADHLIDVNVGGAERLADAVAAEGVRHVVYIGSYSVHDKTAGPTADDLREMSPRAASSQAKLVVQLLLERRAETDSGFRLDTVSPSYMMGPWQLDPTYFGVLYHLVHHCRLKRALPGGVNLVDVRDVAQAVIGCLEADQPQRRLAAGDNISFQEMFRIMNRIAGRPYDPRPIPAGLLRSIPRLRFFGDFGRPLLRPPALRRPRERDRSPLQRRADHRRHHRVHPPSPPLPQPLAPAALGDPALRLSPARPSAPARSAEGAISPPLGGYGQTDQPPVRE